MSGGSPPGPMAGARRFRRAFLLALAMGISLLFFVVVRRFLLAVLLAAVFAGLAYPFHRWMLLRMGRRMAATTTLVILLAGVGLPVAGFLAMVATEAGQISNGVEAWFQDAARMARIEELLGRLPFGAQLVPGVDQIIGQVREAAGGTSTLLLGRVAAATRGTLSIFLQLLVLFYALFYFLIDGPKTLETILRYIPLERAQKDELLERFLSVTRATLRGSLLIGVVQGTVAGLAFWIAGVPGPAFWGGVMVMLSIVPIVGAVIVWVPAGIYLVVGGQVAAGVGLLIWCAVVVGSLDNILRPRLIGRDARMSDLLILLSTLGGILLFGAVGFIVGPIVAALFVTIWDFYGEVFHDWLSDEPQPAGEADGPGPSPRLESFGEV